MGNRPEAWVLIGCASLGSAVGAATRLSVQPSHAGGWVSFVGAGRKPAPSVAIYPSLRTPNQGHSGVQVRTGLSPPRPRRRPPPRARSEALEDDDDDRTL